MIPAAWPCKDFISEDHLQKRGRRTLGEEEIISHINEGYSSDFRRQQRLGRYARTTLRVSMANPQSGTAAKIEAPVVHWTQVSVASCIGEERGPRVEGFEEAYLAPCACSTM